MPRVTRTQVYGALTANWQKLEEICELLGAGVGGVRAHLRALVKRGEVFERERDNLEYRIKSMQTTYPDGVLQIGVSL